MNHDISSVASSNGQADWGLMDGVAPPSDPAPSRGMKLRGFLRGKFSVVAGALGAAGMHGIICGGITLASTSVGAGMGSGASLLADGALRYAIPALTAAGITAALEWPYLRYGWRQMAGSAVIALALTPIFNQFLHKDHNLAVAHEFLQAASPSTRRLIEERAKALDLSPEMVVVAGGCGDSAVKAEMDRFMQRRLDK